MTIPVIETRYKGYRFRSRLEARWAVFFDALEEPWDYEREGFALHSGRYLPDFWLSRLGCWLEIKGETPTEHERKLCTELAYATAKPVVLGCGLPRNTRPALNRWGHKVYLSTGLTVFCEDIGDSSGGWGEWDESFWAFDRDGNLCICSNCVSDRSFWVPGMSEPWRVMRTVDEIREPLPDRYMERARAARFEHGESG